MATSFIYLNQCHSAVRWLGGSLELPPPLQNQYMAQVAVKQGGSVKNLNGSLYQPPLAPPGYCYWPLAGFLGVVFTFFLLRLGLCFVWDTEIATDTPPAPLDEDVTAWSPLATAMDIWKKLGGVVHCFLRACFQNCAPDSFTWASVALAPGAWAMAAAVDLVKAPVISMPQFL